MIRVAVRDAAGARIQATQAAIAGDPLKRWLLSVGEIMLNHLRDRYIKRSRGGWPPLAPSTIARRRKGDGRKVTRGGRPIRRAAGPAAILIDTGTLLAGLNDQRVQGKTVTVGYLRASRHPTGPTLQQLARWHAAGAGRLPIRRIIVPPDRRTLQTIDRLAIAMLQKASRP